MTATEVFQVAAAVLASLGGAGALLWALSSFLAKVWAARILEADRAKYAVELERLKAEIEAKNKEFQGRVDKTIRVHRVQFETEFNALKDVWATLCRLRGVFGLLRPIMSTAPFDETPDQKLAKLTERLKAVGVAFNEARTAADSLSPFYDATIYAAIEALLQTAHHELIDVQVSEPFKGVEWWKTAQQNQEQLFAQADTVAALIRGRLAHLAVFSDE